MVTVTRVYWHQRFSPTFKESINTVSGRFYRALLAYAITKCKVEFPPDVEHARQLFCFAVAKYLNRGLDIDSQYYEGTDGWNFLLEVVEKNRIDSNTLFTIINGLENKSQKNGSMISVFEKQYSKFATKKTIISLEGYDPRSKTIRNGMIDFDNLPKNYLQIQQECIIKLAPFVVTSFRDFLFISQEEEAIQQNELPF